MTALQVRYYFHWDVVWRHIHRLYGGLFLGLELAVVALFIGSLIGLGGAFARTSRSRVLRAVFAAYVEFIRNVPLLLQLSFAYFGLPKVGISFLNNVSSFVMALAIYSGAFLTEVFGAGIGSIPTGYIEAGTAIGPTRVPRVPHGSRCGRSRECAPLPLRAVGRMCVGALTGSPVVVLLCGVLYGLAIVTTRVGAAAASVTGLGPFAGARKTEMVRRRSA